MKRQEVVITRSAMRTEQRGEVFRKESREAPLYSIYSDFEHRNNFLWTGTARGC